jgi:nitrite transporter NirC
VFYIFEDDFSAVAAAARKKSDFLSRNPLGYFVSSMMAGIHVGFAVLLLSTIGGVMAGDHIAKILMGVSFGIALSLVIVAGSDLFTGSNLVMTAGALDGEVRWSDALRVWIVCHIGNWVGSILLALLFWKTGLSTEAIGTFIVNTTAGKMNVQPIPLFIRGILCNILVCLGVWCGYKCKSESGRLIMIFWCVYAFISTGFEHSVANMTMLTLGLLLPHGAEVSIGGYFYNILLVSAGNLVGGAVFVAMPYFMMKKSA